MVIPHQYPNNYFALHIPGRGMVSLHPKILGNFLETFPPQNRGINRKELLWKRFEIFKGKVIPIIYWEKFTLHKN